MNGYFLKTDPRLEGLKWGNWGSRPYEYAWISNAVNVSGKRVIDLGVGLPSQYDWYKYVLSKNPSFYAGIDYDGRIKEEEVKMPSYEIAWMNMAELKYPDESFDVAYCISVLEHLPYDIFKKAVMETSRVLVKGGYFVITMDEVWDSTLTNEDVNQRNSRSWNLLDQDMSKKGMISCPISLYELIDMGLFPGFKKNSQLDRRVNSNREILYNEYYNDCVSKIILEKT